MDFEIYFGKYIFNLVFNFQLLEINILNIDFFYYLNIIW